MKTIEIKNRLIGDIIYSGTFENIKECIKDAVEKGVSLNGADLRGADLKGINLSGADLIGANLIEVDLSGADLYKADLSGADLYKADLYKAVLYKADLSEADLLEADLYEADLYGANLSRAKNYYSFVAFDTSKRLVHCVKNKDTWMIRAGCFWGTLEELEAKVKKTHNSKVYLANIEILKGIQ